MQNGLKKKSKTQLYSICVHAKSLNHVQLFAVLWIVARQAPLSMGFSNVPLSEQLKAAAWCSCRCNPPCSGATLSHK